MHYLGMIWAAPTWLPPLWTGGNLLGKASLPTPRGAERVADQMAAACRLRPGPGGRVRRGGGGRRFPGTIEPEQGVMDSGPT